MRWILGGALWACVVGSGGCSWSDRVGVLSVPDAGRDAGAQGVTDAGADAGEDAGMDRRQEYCARPGPAWVLDPGTGADVCVGHVAARAFKQAVCSIEYIHMSDYFSTDTMGAPDGRAWVWTGSEFTSSTTAVVGGWLQVDGPPGIVTNSSLYVEGSLLNGGSLKNSPAFVTVRGDVKVAGDSILNQLEVDGTVTQNDGRIFRVDAGSPDYNNGRVDSDSFPRVCPKSPFEDITSLVQLNGADNHDSLIGLEPRSLEGFTEARRSLSLPCGRFYLSSITGAGDVQLEVTGRTTLFVGGPVSVGNLTVTLTGDAELDLFIQGSLSASNQLTLNENGKPSQLRIYVQTQLNGLKGDKVSAHLYAPAATMNLDGGLTMSGSLFVRTLVSGGAFLLHYDPDVLQLEARCP